MTKSSGKPKLRKAIPILLMSLLTILGTIVVMSDYSTSPLQVDRESILADARRVNMTAIYEQIVKFSSFGTRMTGYSECSKAAKYIYDQFSSYGLSNISYHYFPAVVPIDRGAKITIIKPDNVHPIDVYPCWPNLVAPTQTPPGGLMGPLIYAGDGLLRELNGKPINGTIALMNFNSQNCWIDLAKIGAKAVIFIEPTDTSFEESKLKHLDYVPFNFPRVFVSRADAEGLMSLLEKGQEVIVNLQSNMVWERVMSPNVIGYIRGSSHPDEYVLLTARYDSFSIVPSVAPGAEEAIGISVLLELAKYYAKNPAKYTLVFAAFSGTDLGVVGSRYFIKEYVVDKWNYWGKKVILQMDFGGINSYLPTLALTITDGFGFRATEQIAKWVPNLERLIFEKLLPEVGSTLNLPSIGPTVDQRNNFWRNTFATTISPWAFKVSIYRFWGEPVICQDQYALYVCGGPGTGWMTPWTFKKYMFTPLDLPEKMNLENLNYQLQFIYPITDIIINLEGLQGEYLPKWNPQFSQQFGPLWVDVTLQVAEYNYATGWYDPVPDAIVAYRRVHGGGQSGGCYPMGIHTWSYDMSDAVGEVKIPALQQYYGVGDQEITAYVVNSTTGNVLYAPNFGEKKAASLIESSMEQTLRFGPEQQPTDLGILTVFKCGSIVLFDVGDPYNVNSPYTHDLFLSVNDFRSHSVALDRGSSLCIYPSGRSVGMVHVNPGMPAEILLKCAYALVEPLGSLANASEGKMAGVGYALQEYGQQLILTHTALRIAEDMYWIAKSRIDLLRATGVYVTYLDKLEKAETMISLAHQAIENRQYDKAYAYYTDSWPLIREVTLDFKSTATDTVNTLPFFGIVLIPFAFLFERLVFSSEGRKRVLLLLLSYGVPLIVLIRIHPSFYIASNALMVIISFVIIILMSPVLGIIFSIAQGAVRRKSEEIFGKHVKTLMDTISRSAVSTVSFSMGIGNLRKRRLRTILLMLSVIMITTGLVAFTSVTGFEVIKPAPMAGNTPYNGVMVHLPSWGFLDYFLTEPTGRQGTPAVGEEVVQVLQAKYGDRAIISPAAWRPTTISITYGVQIWNLNEQKTHFAYGMLGVTSQLCEILAIDTCLIDGAWFTPENEGMDVCIISKTAASDLGIKNVPAEISLMGMRFNVIAILDDQKFDSINDLNQAPITPLDLSWPGWATHLTIRDVVIVPYRTLISLGGRTMSVSMKFKNVSLIRDSAEEIFERFRWTVYVCEDSNLYTYSEKSEYVVAGLETQIVPLLIVAFIALNMMLSNIQSRRSEISTLSSLGLSPFHVSMLFLSESITFAVLGSVLGYLVGMATITLILQLSPGAIIANFSSTWVIIATVVMMGMILASTTYPLRQAYSLVTPSLERRWRAPEPRGDVWAIHMPFITEKEEEAYGILSYVSELFEAHKVERPEIFQTLSASYAQEEDPKFMSRKLSVEVFHAPYEMGIKSKAAIINLKDKRTNRHSFDIEIRRTSGNLQMWKSASKTFIDLVRKQFLVWRSLSVEAKLKYTAIFSEARKSGGKS